jgi:hypothetical protein
MVEAYLVGDTKLVKTAGEHWTCAMLARHGWAPALTRDGTERTDVLAVSTRLSHRPTVEVQVIPEGAGPVNPVVLVVDLSFGVLRRFLGASR